MTAAGGAAKPPRASAGAPRGGQDLRAVARQMQLTRQAHGVGYGRQFLDMLRLCRGRLGLEAKEYYQLGLYRRGMSLAQKRTFVGSARNNAVMERLNISPQANYKSLFYDKVVFDRLAAALGLTTPRLQAYHGATGLPGVTSLRTAEDILAFLSSRAEFPVFCKPRFGSHGEGAALLDGIRAGDGRLMLGDGRDVDAEGFARRVVERHQEGYLFQSAVSQRDDLVAVFGKAAAVFRVATIRPRGQPAEIFYVIARLARPDSMGVLTGTPGLYSAEVDPRSGRLISDFWPSDWFFDDGLRRETALGVDRDEIAVPGIAEMCAAALTVHDHFPAIAVLGFDIIMGDAGPVILEGNFRPATTIVQRLRDTGLLDDGFDPRLAALLKG